MGSTQDADRRTDRTQDSDRTEALSQWVFDQYKGRSKSSGPSQAEDKGAPSRLGQLGYVDLKFDPPQISTREESQSNTAPVGGRLNEEFLSSPLSQPDLGHDLFPEDLRFADPITPGIGATKRNAKEFETPAPQRNPFCNPFDPSGIRSSGPIGLTQAFRNTQAPSSPVAGVLIPSSDRPSPQFNHIQRSPSIDLDLSSVLRSTNVHSRQWRQQPALREPAAPASSPASAAKSFDLFDQLQKKDENLRQRTRSLREEQKRTTQVLSNITAKSSLSHASVPERAQDRSNSPKETPVMSHPSSPTGQVASEEGLTESEAETEHEVVDFSLHKQTSRSSIHDEDKENRTDVLGRRLRSNLKQPREVLEEDRHCKLPQDSSDITLADRVGRDTRPSDSNCNSADAVEAAGNSPHSLMLTIADSQRSTREEQPASAKGPNTSESSLRLVQESQSGNVPDSSENLNPPIENNAARSSSLPPASPSLRKAPPSGSRASNVGVVVRFSSSEGNTRGTKRGNVIFEETPIRPTIRQSIIPETTFASRHPPYNSTHPSSLITPSVPKRLVASQGTLRSCNETVQSHEERLSRSNTPEQSQLPLGLMEITESRLRETQSQQVDLDIELLNSDDIEYVAKMEKYSSPISHSRRRRVKRGGNPSTPAIIQEQTLYLADAGEEADSVRSESHTVPNDRRSQSMFDQGALSRIDTSPEVSIQQANPAHAPEKINSRHDQSVMQPELELHGSRSPSQKPQEQARVFAHWSGGGGLSFYPATCLATRPLEPRLTVRFDYGEMVTEIKSSQVKRLELRKGDHVRIDVDKFRNQVYIVQECFDSIPESRGNQRTDIFGNCRVRVRPKSKIKNVQCLEFPITSVYHELQTWKQFKGRDHTLLGEDLTLHNQQGDNRAQHSYVTPGTKRRSFLKDLHQKSFPNTIISDAKRKGRGMFTGTVFVLTNISESSRKQIESMILENGGKVLEEGFEALFLPCKHHGRASSAPSSASKHGSSVVSRSSPVPSDSIIANGAFEHHLRLRPSTPDDTAAFLITSSHCRNTKYFEALALGIPCLSYRWIEYCSAQASLISWRHFVLAAGESALLDGAVISRSLALPSEENVNWPLREMLERRPAWLSHQRVLFIGLDRSSTNAHIFLAHVLGAAEIATSKDDKEARQILSGHEEPKKTFDIVIFNGSEIFDSRQQETVAVAVRPAKRRRAGKDDADMAMSANNLASEFGCRVLSTEFVMQSLILGKLLG